jgi:hypothetical protein
VLPVVGALLVVIGVAAAPKAAGHVVSGSWSFQLTVAGTGRPGPPAGEKGSAEGIPIGPVTAVAAALVAGLLLYAARGRRRRRRRDG